MSLSADLDSQELSIRADVRNSTEGGHAAHIRSEKIVTQKS